MTDNEKRAHDLALFALDQYSKVLPLEARENAIQNGKNEITFDIYKEYKKYFSQLLASFNRDFPEGK